MKHTVQGFKNLLSALLLSAMVLCMMTSASFSLAEEEKALSDIPWPVKTILNLDEAEQDKIVDASEVRFLEFRMPRRDIWIPVTVRDVTVIADEEDSARWAGGMYLKDFRQAFPWVEEGVQGLYVLTELGSGVRIGELDKTFGEFYPNEEYFGPMMKPGHKIEREFDVNGPIFSDGTSPVSILNINTLDWVGFIRIKQVLLHWSIEEYLYRNPDFDEWYGFIHPSTLLYRYLMPTDERLVEAAESASMGTMRVKEYREQIYEKLFAPEHWPVSLAYRQDKDAAHTVNLPKLKEDILSSSIDGYSILLIFKSANEYGEYTDPYKVSVVKNTRDLEKGKWYTSDLYTDENIDYEGILPYLKQNEVIEEISSVSKNKNHIVVEGLTNPYLVDILQRMVYDTTTVRDMVELYEQLPAEYQVDYSYFDFSKSPNVDPAWLASRPAPPPTPTPPPYTELTLGSRGQEVLDMKGRFYELGYLRTDKYNDQYSKNTADTVRLFEKNNGLLVDGVADAVMLGVLFSDKALGK